MSGRHPPYPAYRQSEVDGLGEIPEDWSLTRLKFVSQCLDGQRVPLNATERGEMEGDIPYWGASKVVGHVNAHIFDEELVLLGEDGAPFFEPHRDVAFFVSGKIWPNNHVHVLRPNLSRIEPRFLTYGLNCTPYHLHITGSTRDKLNQSDMNEIVLRWCRLEEQNQIANFLDHETAKIDALIEKQRQLIALLKEKRQAVISHAVTKGLNPDAPMRDSGVEWLGEVPAHWVTKRLKHISPKIGVGLVINPSTYTRDEGTYFIFGGDVKEHGFDLANARRISQEDSDRLTPSRLSEGDIVSVRVGDPGVTAVVPPDLEGANCASVIIVRRGEFDSHWFCSVMNSWVGRQQVGLVAYGAAQKQFNVSDAVEFVFPVPPPDEQQAIAKFISEQLEKFDALSSSATRAVALLQERRTALISAAVTGKIDVRNWQAPSSQPEPAHA